MQVNDPVKDIPSHDHKYLLLFYCQCITGVSTITEPVIHARTFTQMLGSILSFIKVTECGSATGVGLFQVTLSPKLVRGEVLFLLPLLLLNQYLLLLAGHSSG